MKISMQYGTKHNLLKCSYQLNSFRQYEATIYSGLAIWPSQNVHLDLNMQIPEK